MLMMFIRGLIMQVYRINMKLLVIFSLFFCHLAFADVVCQIKSGGVLDNMVTDFGHAAQNWQNQINPIAHKIFYALFGMEFMWQLTVKKVFAGDIEKLWVFFFTRAVLGLFFAKYLVNPEIYQAAIISIAKIGTNMGGYALNLNAGNNFNGFGPSEIMGHFACLADSIHAITDDTGSFEYITIKLTLAIVQVVLFIVLAFIAYSLMKTILQTYFLLYVGFFLTGFAGSSWTANYWEKYVQTLSGMAIKFLSVSLIMGVLITQMNGWINGINVANGDITKLSSILLQVLGSSFIIALIVRELPEWASSSLSGSVNVRFADSILNVSKFMSGGGSNSLNYRSGINTSTNPTIAAASVAKSSVNSELNTLDATNLTGSSKAIIRSATGTDKDIFQRMVKDSDFSKKISNKH